MEFGGFVDFWGDGFLPDVYSRDANTYFGAKYVKRCNCADRYAFGVQKKHLIFRPPFSPENRHLGSYFDRT